MAEIKISNIVFIFLFDNKLINLLVYTFITMILLLIIEQGFNGHAFIRNLKVVLTNHQNGVNTFYFASIWR